MGQSLAMPINQSTITCCYKEEAPQYRLLGAGPVHYGVDMIGSPNPIYASGNGVVLSINTDAGQTVGKWIAIKYTDVEGYGDLVARYFHLAEVYVKVGQAVTLDTKIAKYGNTGPYSKGAHLHIELDRDTKHWNYTPTIAGAAGQLRPGTRGNGDTTVNPLDVFRLKKTAPEKQTYVLEYDVRYRKRVEAITNRD